MYKLLLAWRYLKTRYIALASIISVTLGVATLIVVNAVMSGFTHEMRDRLHGVLSDVEIKSAIKIRCKNYKNKTFFVNSHMKSKTSEAPVSM